MWKHPGASTLLVLAWTIWNCNFMRRWVPPKEILYTLCCWDGIVQEKRNWFIVIIHNYGFSSFPPFSPFSSFSSFSCEFLCFQTTIWKVIRGNWVIFMTASQRGVVRLGTNLVNRCKLMMPLFPKTTSKKVVLHVIWIMLRKVMRSQNSELQFYLDIRFSNYDLALSMYFV